jgi:UDP-N-acetylmuramoyl-L-alanyl-D-glutamate--2,6-diaminopimelate ligase
MAAGLQRAARPPVPSGPYLVAGLGKAGTAASNLLAGVAGPAGVTVWDAADHGSMRRLADGFEQRGMRGRLGGDGIAALDASGARCLVKSPGIAMTHPLVEAARQRGLVVLDELELAWRQSPLPMIGVTGTKGKSTVTTLVASVCRAAVGEALVAGNTDFAPAWSSIDSPAGIAVCEVSSAQLEGSVDLLPDVAVFTNLHPEANRHGSLEATAAIKRTMFVRGDRCAPLAVVNFDDPYGREIASAVSELGGRALTYGAGAGAGYQVREARWTLDGTELALRTSSWERALRARAPGAMNALNVAAAAAVGEALGLGPEEIADAVAAAEPPPGRFERVDRGQPFDVLTDMAHTPESIRQCLITLRAVVDERPGASLRAVVGIIGSTAMAGPREETGRIARSLTDHLVVAGSSYRGEPPLINAARVLRGARAVAGGQLDVVLDRREAIELAIRAARPGDVVVALGRGPVREMTFDSRGGGYRASDSEIAAAALDRLGATR